MIIYPISNYMYMMTEYRFDLCENKKMFIVTPFIWPTSNCKTCNVGGCWIAWAKLNKMFRVI